MSNDLDDARREYVANLRAEMNEPRRVLVKYLANLERFAGESQRVVASSDVTCHRLVQLANSLREYQEPIEKMQAQLLGAFNARPADLGIALGPLEPDGGA